VALPSSFPLRTRIEALIAVVLFGCIPVVVRSLSANSWTIGIFRLAVATAVLSLVLLARGQLRRVSGADLLRLAVIGFLFFGHWLSFFFAIKASSASIAAIGLSTYGIALLIFGAMAARRRPAAVDIIAVLLAATGAILVVPSLDISNAVTAGMLLAVLSALFYAALPILHQKWAFIASSQRTLGQFAFALLFFLLFAGRSDWNLDARNWWGLLFLALGPTLIAHSLWVRVTTTIPAEKTSIIYYGNLPFAVILSSLILGEALTGRILLGGILIAAGSLLGLVRRSRLAPAEREQLREGATAPPRESRS
jgi:drug/metabolite transporter (DMT)-like permease